MKTSEFYFMLKPSPIDGVGVFAVKAFPKGAVFELFVEGDSRYLRDVPPAFRKYVMHGDAPRIMCPADFRRMSVGWFMNLSDNPNVKDTGDYYYKALRDIQAGEEITVREYT